VKTCYVCKLEKPFTDFYKRAYAKDGCQPYCKACQKVRIKAYYDANPTPTLERTKHNKREARRLFDEWMSQQACIDCGESDPVVLDCDHVRGTKRNNVSTMVGRGDTWKLISEELEKCEVRCANCHRRKTRERAAKPQ
jgi:hypothetical protein